MDFIPVMSSGRPIVALPDTPEALAETLIATAALYEKVGFHPPWTSYVAAQDGICVGICGFKSAPVAGDIEIAYFTLPGHEGNGYASRMAAFLIRIANSAKPAPVVTAQTLPEENASARILRKLGLEMTGTVEHPEDGLVWQWRQPITCA